MISPCYFIAIDSKDLTLGPRQSLTLDAKIFQRNLKRLTEHAKKKHHLQLTVETASGDFWSNPKVVKLLKKSKIRSVVIYGSGLAHGIFATVQKLLQKNFNVWMVTDAIQSSTTEDREMDFILLRKEGAQMWNTEFIIKNT